jgi:hypothetical protein
MPDNSAGPITPEGKAISSRNSLKHGLRACSALLPGESPRSFQKFSARLRKKLQPDDAIEQVLADRIIGAAWRLRRLIPTETEAYLTGIRGERRWGNSSESEEPAAELMAGRGFLRETNSFAVLARYEAALERSMYRAMSQLRVLQGPKILRKTEKPEELG